MSGVLFTPPRATPVSSSGRPYPGAKRYFYQAGTTTPIAVYSDSALSVLAANPQVADSAGKFLPVFLDPDGGNYKTVLTTSAGVQLEADDNIPPYAPLSQPAVGAALYPRTAAEISAAVIPTNYAYPMGDVRRYGARFDGVTDDSAAIVTCATVLAAGGGGTVVLPEGTAAISGISYQYLASKSVNFRGAGELATNLVKLGTTTTPVMELIGPASLYDIHSTLSGFTIRGSSTAPALRTKNCARFTLQHLTLRNASIGFHNQGSLIFSVHDCTIRNNVVPYKQEKLNGIYCNLITFKGGAITFNSGIGELNHGSNVTFENVDVEVNGTAGVLTTGAFKILSTMAEETGEAFVNFIGGWFERNYGTPLVVENAAGLRLMLRDGFKFLFNEGGIGATVGTVNIFSCDGVHSNDSIVVGAAGLSFISNSNLGALTDGATTRVYQNSQINAAVVPLAVTTSGIVTSVDNSGNLIGGADIRAAGTVSSGSGVAFGSTVNLLDNAGAGTGTLTNCPVNGNPTKWIRVNDNGTLRYLPAW